MTAGRVAHWPLPGGKKLADLALHLRSAEDVPHAWMIGYPDHEPDGPRLELFVVDDIDVYAHHDGRVPGGDDQHLPRPSALPEHLRARTRLTGVPIVVTLPTPPASDNSGDEIPGHGNAPRTRSSESTAPGSTRSTPFGDTPGNTRVMVLRNRFGPQASKRVAHHSWGELSSFTR